MSSEDENDFTRKSTTTKKKKKRNVIESDDESEDHSNNDETPEIGVKRKRQRTRSANAITESEEDDNNSSTNEMDVYERESDTDTLVDNKEHSLEIENEGNQNDNADVNTENGESSSHLRRSSRLKGKKQPLIENGKSPEKNPIPDDVAVTPKRSNRLKLKAEKQSPTPSKLKELDKIEDIDYDENEVYYFRKVQSRRDVNNLVIR